MDEIKTLLTNIERNIKLIVTSLGHLQSSVENPQVLGIYRSVMLCDQREYVEDLLTKIQHSHEKPFLLYPSKMTANRVMYEPLNIKKNPKKEELMEKVLSIQSYKHKHLKNKQKKVLDISILKSTPDARESVRMNEFPTGSTYSGGWCYTGMEGSGIYQLASGSKYLGEFRNGLFAGVGAFRFPHGGIMQGYWINGVLFNPEYVFSDGLIYNPMDWGYCRMPDRRFYSEHADGLKPAGNIQKSNDHPAPDLPPGCFDTVEGVYNPFTRELRNPVTGRIMRILSACEQPWIINNCRREWELPVPFNPYLYENWFPETNKYRHKSRRKISIWNSEIQKYAERTGITLRIYNATHLQPNILKESQKKLSVIGSSMDKPYTKRVNIVSHIKN